jgi:hypothetical protein
MARLLDDLSCPRALGECRALLRGAVAAKKHPLPSVLVRELFAGREPRFRNLAQADEFVASLLALLELYEGRFRGGAFVGSEAPRDAAEPLEDRAGRRYREVRAFLRGLDLGATDPAALDAAGRAALEALAEASSFLAAIAGLAAEVGSTGTHIEEAASHNVGYLEQVTDDCMVRLELCLRAARPADGARDRDAGAGPSDLCPCGSGRPARRCCSAPT